MLPFYKFCSGGENLDSINLLEQNWDNFNGSTSLLLINIRHLKLIISSVELADINYYIYNRQTIKILLYSRGNYNQLTCNGKEYEKE